MRTSDEGYIEPNAHRCHDGIFLEAFPTKPRGISYDKNQTFLAALEQMHWLNLPPHPVSLGIVKVSILIVKS
jgi:hypothetical protein